MRFCEHLFRQVGATSAEASAPGPDARAYQRTLEELSGYCIATGANRDDTIILDDPFA